MIAANPAQVAQSARTKPTMLAGWFVGQVLKADRRQGQRRPVVNEMVAKAKLGL
jgi:Asp-tRNA(Asn)/Glu-tRNA(Gln) amidotransferase B subunit